MLVQVHDTLSRSLRPLQASDGRRFRVYCCGPTVYAPAHIGNFRTFVLNDVLRRIAIVAGLPVFFVRNLTDVDDKTIAGARAAGQSLADLTRHWIDVFHEDERALNLLPADAEPRATEHIPEQIELIQQLINNELAYVAADGSVYYRVAAFRDYGKLSGFDPEELRSQQENSAGQVNTADEYERETVADFALWKAWKPEDGDVAWDSPWGRGRPGWHLECSAMSLKHLGNGLDLHTGGVDLCFPHHENEIAQSEGATGQPFCHHWWHASHLLVDGKKMSKSLGNFHTVRDLLAAGHPPAALRFALISAHYRHQLNFTLKGVEDARKALDKLRKLVRELRVAAGDPAEGPGLWEQISPPPGEPEDAATAAKRQAAWAEAAGFGRFTCAWEALADDLNTPAALGALFGAPRTPATDPAAARRDLVGLHQILWALGLDRWLREEPADPATASTAPAIPEEVRTLAEERWAARLAKDFAASDRLRAELAARGWSVRDRKDGYDLAQE